MSSLLTAPRFDLEGLVEPEEKTVAAKPRFDFRQSSLVTFLLLAAPALWLGYLVYGYGVDVPWGDQWDGMRQLFEKNELGTLGLGDFFAFHNEHRIFFPRLLTFAVARLTHWNIRVEILVIWILACLCAVNIWRLAVATGFPSARAHVGLLFAAYILLFTPLQWENLLWGFQIGFFVPLVCMSALPWLACLQQRRLSFCMTILLALINTFSIASGFTSWLSTAPLLLVIDGWPTSRGQKILWLIWISAAVGSTFAYFHGYNPPSVHPNQLEALRHPGPAVQFILAYLGNPFASGIALNVNQVGQAVGAALLLILGGCCSYIWRWRKDAALVRRAVPWLSLISTALFSAGLTMIGRVGYGVHAAMQSRYVTFAILLPIGLIFLVACISRHRREQDPFGGEKLNIAIVALSAVFAVLLLCATVHTLRLWYFFRHDRLCEKAVLTLIDVIKEPEAVRRYAHWNEQYVRGWADDLDRIGYLHPPLLKSPRIRGIAYEPGSERLGDFDSFVRTEAGEMVASGWAILPADHRIADSVLLTFEREDGEPIIFARADVRLVRDDVTLRYDDDTYRNSGWTKTWKLGDVPPDTKRIAAWAFNSEECRAYPIGGAKMQ